MLVQKVQKLLSGSCRIEKGKEKERKGKGESLLSKHFHQPWRLSVAPDHIWFSLLSRVFWDLPTFDGGGLSCNPLGDTGYVPRGACWSYCLGGCFHFCEWAQGRPLLCPRPAPLTLQSLCSAHQRQCQPPAASCVGGAREWHLLPYLCKGIWVLRYIVILRAVVLKSIALGKKTSPDKRNQKWTEEGRTTATCWNPTTWQLLYSHYPRKASHSPVCLVLLLPNCSGKT